MADFGDPAFPSVEETLIWAVITRDLLPKIKIWFPNEIGPMRSGGDELIS